MIYLLVALIYFFKCKGSVFSPTRFLFMMLFFSSVAAFLVGRQPGYEIDSILNVMYIVILLVILFVSVRGWSFVGSFCSIDIDQKRLRLVERIMTVLGFLLFINDIFILIKVFPLLILGTIDVQAYKNEGEAYEVITNFVPRVFITLANFLGPLGYFFITFHFYYLLKGRGKTALKYLLLSLILILNGLVFMSRSSTILYVLTYIPIFAAIYKLLNHNIRKTIVRIFSIGALVMSVFFMGISASRFSDYYGKHSLNKAIIDEGSNPILFSLLDYAGQWEECSLIMLDRYKPEYRSWGMYNACGIGVQVQKVIKGSENVNREREKKYDPIFRDDIVNFHGVITRCVFDFGYIGTFLYILIISFVNRKLSPKNKVVMFGHLLAAPLILRFPLDFYIGNAFGNLTFDIAIIYSIFIYLFIKKRKVANSIAI